MHGKIKEVEIKYKICEEEKKQLEAYLKKMNAEFVGHVSEEDIYYTRPDSDFLKTRECLRIRKTADYSELTYKPSTTTEMKKKRIFWKKEVNIKINNQVDNVKELLKDLEYKELTTVHKERYIYKIYDIIASLDWIDSLGWFIELEIQSDNEIYALKTIEEYAVKLKLKDKNIVNEPYRDLLLK